MSTFTSRIRLFVDAALAAGATVEPSDDQAHYLTHVMRVRDGGAVVVFNGRDGEWDARVSYPSKRQVRLAVDRQLRPQNHEPDVWLAFAPVKRIDVLVEKATELGVGRLLPTITRRTTVARVNLARLSRQAAEAAEQSDRLSVPEIAAPVDFATLIADWPSSRRLYFLDETGGGAPIGELFKQSTPNAGGFLTGPEGGFEQVELDALRGLPFATAVGLGPRVLRAETAAIAALVCWQALLGDWTRGRGA